MKLNRSPVGDEVTVKMFKYVGIKLYKNTNVNSNNMENRKYGQGVVAGKIMSHTQKRRQSHNVKITKKSQC